MRDQISIMVGFALGIICMFAVNDAYSMEQQAIFTPSGGGGIPPWQFGLILIMPGIAAVSMTILWMRYQRIFALDEGITLTRRQWFRRTVIVGAIVGVACQGGLQGVVMYLTGMPIMWELLGMAVLLTGTVAAFTYEVARWWLARKIKKGEHDYIPAYEWLSLKRYDTGAPIITDTDDGTIMTPFMRSDAPLDYEDTQIMPDHEKPDYDPDKTPTPKP